MHSHPMRLRAVYLAVAALLAVTACGDNARSASAPHDQRPGSDTPLGQDGSAEGQPGMGGISESGLLRPGTGRSVVDGSSGPIDPEPETGEGRPELGRPDEVLPAVRKQLDLDAASRPGAEVLEAVEPLDQAPAAGESIGIRDGRTINEAGELNRLDEPAALACGDVERALTALDSGDEQEAVDLLASAADRADRSNVDDIEAWSTTLADTAEVDTDRSGSLVALLGFLSTCTHGGYEL